MERPTRARLHALSHGCVPASRCWFVSTVVCSFVGVPCACGCAVVDGCMCCACSWECAMSSQTRRAPGRQRSKAHALSRGAACGGNVQRGSSNPPHAEPAWSVIMSPRDWLAGVCLVVHGRERIRACARGRVPICRLVCRAGSRPLHLQGDRCSRGHHLRSGRAASAQPGPPQLQDLCDRAWQPSKAVSPAAGWYQSGCQTMVLQHQGCVQAANAAARHSSWLAAGWRHS